ncbi:MAG: nuclear transport factor 2 family protein [Polaromonas sp.]|jgi:ketosteroid isomerase-like protein|nr:nuclear transport factor 2 family protein [Polaromonas sp.]MBK7502413.1 nuclear transport factor 2 family protein [Polaromonas sp.]MBP6088678.1 nuclear transport factor 2 family protein [Polaromonas sp.]MBP6156451.1 nuclear transport factor 2 family protein [Polaromonas sp.]MBP7116260.1 nuclear transport factor 2 family protein [Polaromonas sp.]
MTSITERNAQTINRFYNAFSTLDAEMMATCYADNVQFQDEVFSLSGKNDTVNMWRMLCAATISNPEALKAWKLTFNDVKTAANIGQAHWEAHYLFSKTGRNVVNKIDAVFTFNELGQIIIHRDSFDFWAWSRQALGLPGLLLGWTPFMRDKVKATATQGLAKFVKKA